VRTTIDVPDDLLAEAKARAAREGRTLSAVVGDALRGAFARADESRRAPVRLTTFRGEGVRPGVDLDDGAALLDLLDGRD
jgi:hypothetical protein